MEGPKFSIIIPTYNSEISIVQTLESIIAQSFNNVEVLIIDGQSTDGTISLVAPYVERYTFKLISEKDEGVYDAMNKGISLAKGDYLYFMGSDDVFYDQEILAQINSQLAQDIDLLYGNVLFKNSKIVYSGESSLHKLVKDQISICHQAIFYHQNVFKIIGNYNTEFFIHADYDFNIRCFRNEDLTIKYTEQIISIFNERGLSGIKSNADNFHTQLTERNILEEFGIIPLYEENQLLKKKIFNLEQSKAFKLFKIIKKIKNAFNI